MNSTIYNGVLLLSIALIAAGVAMLASAPWSLVAIGGLSLMANFVHLFVISFRPSERAGRDD